VTTFLLIIGLVNLALVLVVAKQWRFLNRVGQVTLSGLAFALLPIAWSAAVVTRDLNQMKTVEFCESCHVMEDYVASLTMADDDSIPAIHYRNNWVAQKTACYDCHTSYSMFGDVKAKFNGLKHVMVNYLGTVPEKIELYQPYANSDCLHCHGPSEKFQKRETHEFEMEYILSGESSCLEGGCHDVGHLKPEGS